MKRNTLLQNTVTALLMLAILVIPFSLSVSGQATTTTEVFYSNEVYIIPGASSGICYYALTMVPANAADILAGRVSSDNPAGVAFAIMTTDQYVGFLDPALNPGPGSSGFAKHTCTGLAGSSKYHNEGQFFQFQWTASTYADYWLVMLNANSASNTVTLSVNRITSAGGRGFSRTGSTNYPTSYTSAYSSAMETHTASATYMPPPTIGPLALPFDPVYLAIALGVAVLAAFLLWQFHSSRRPKPTYRDMAHPRTQQTTRVSEEGFQKQFCLNCGRQIPPGSRFCGKCGAAQT
jgi:ribosomal protein L40E